MRIGLVAALVVAAAVAGAYSTRQRSASAPRRLAWIATAHQFGPVSYRDPAGAISPDGKSIAYSEGRFLRVRPIDGGPSVDLPPGDVQIRNLLWSADARLVAADDRGGAFFLYDIANRTRTALWADRARLRARLEGANAETSAKPSDVRQLAWSPAGRFIAAIVNAREGQELWTIAADGSAATARKMPMRIASPAWTPYGEIACIATENGASRVTIPCGGRPVKTDPPLDLY